MHVRSTSYIQTTIPISGLMHAHLIFRSTRGRKISAHSTALHEATYSGGSSHDSSASSNDGNHFDYLTRIDIGGKRSELIEIKASIPGIWQKHI